MKEKKGVLTVMNIDRDFVSIRVMCDTAEKAAMNPGLDSSMAFITVTRGETHILRVIDKDGRIQQSFYWGYGSETLIGEGAAQLKELIVSVITKARIPYDCNVPKYAKPCGACIMPHYSHYAIRLDYGKVEGKSQAQIWHMKTVADAKRLGERLLGKVEWVTKQTINGTTVIDAVKGGAK